jgi:hypothetical protein
MAIQPGEQFKLFFRATFPPVGNETKPFVYDGGSGETRSNPQQVMREISELERTEPVREKNEYSVGQPIGNDPNQLIISPWVETQSREGRSNLAAELGLPNKKKRRKR